MKKLLLLFLLIPFSAYAQQNAFVLVDVSASSQNLISIKTEAKEVVYKLLTGGFSTAQYPGWRMTNINDSELTNAIGGKSLLSSNSWLCIMPFGNLSRYNNYKIQQLNILPTDAFNFFSSYYPTSYNDNFTYISIAEAFTANIAYSQKISEYYIFMVTDGLGDQDDTDSNNRYNSTEQSLIDEWGNASSSVVSKIGVLENSGYRIIVKKIKNFKWTKTPPTITPVDTSQRSYEIRLNSFAGGKSSNPVKIEREDISISWSCADCPQGTRYTVNISGIQGTKYKDLKRGIQSNSLSTRISSGKYRIMVSGEIPNSQTSVSPASTYIEITAGGVLPILVVTLGVAALIAGLFYFSKKQKESQKNKRGSNGNPNTVSKNNNKGGSSNNDLDIV